MFRRPGGARKGAPGCWGSRGPEDLDGAWSSPEATLGEAVANRERSAGREVARVSLKTSATSSTRQTVSPPVSSDANSSDEDPRLRSASKSVGADSGQCMERPAQQEVDVAWDDGVYTVMVRQIPRHYTQLRFLAELSCCGFGGLVDFIYFPFDVKRGANVGYGFVNFTDPRHARAFRQQFDNVYVDVQMQVKEKPLRVHPASVQGYPDNFSHFARARAGHQKAATAELLRHSPLFMPRGCWLGLAEEIQQELFSLREAFGARQQTGAPTQAPRPSRPLAGPARDRDDPAAHFEAWEYDRRDPAAQGPLGSGRGAAAERGPAPRPPAGVVPPGLPQPRPGRPAAGSPPWGDARGSRPPAARAPPPPHGSELGSYHRLEAQKQRLLTELAAVHEEQRFALELFMSASSAASPAYLSLPLTASRLGGT